MGSLMRTHRWSASPLGPPDQWPQPLRAATALLLGSKFPMFVAWGPELGLLYNDAYAEILGAKHPSALGAPFHDVWSEIWGDISGLIDAALAGEASFRKDLPLVMNRRGFDEQTWFTFSYSPMRDEAGQVAGLFCACQETTDRVLAERRLAEETERQRNIFRQAPGFICTLSGPDHVYDFVNDTYRRLFGDREFVGKTAREAFPELEDQGFFELLDQVFATGERHVATAAPARIRRGPDAPEEERFLDFIFAPVTDGGRRVVGIFCEGQDVTEAHRAQLALQTSETRLRLALEAGRMAVWEHDSATGTLRTSPDLNRMLGYPADAELDLEELRTRYYPGDRERLVAAAVGALESGERFFEAEYRFYRADGALRWFLMRAEITLEAGAPSRTFGVLLDVTERKQVEEELRERETELEAAMAAGKLAMFDCDHVQGRFKASPRFNAIYGYPPDRELTLDDVRRRYHPDDVEAIGQWGRLHAADASLRHFRWTFRIVRPDGEVCWIEGLGEYLRDDAGRIVRSRGVVADVTERKLAEERQRLLINELNHRVKNTLAVVQGLAHQTFRLGADPVAARSTFESRLSALSATHDLLTRRSWGPAPLHQIVQASVEGPAGALADRVSAEGPEVSLPPETAVSFALAVHELATNAVKYGALSNDRGRVSVKWSVRRAAEDPVLQVEWRERDGPGVVTPTRRGFGSRLIEGALARQLGGHVRLTFEPAGVVCTIEAPLRPAALAAAEA